MREREGEGVRRFSELSHGVASGVGAIARVADARAHGAGFDGVWEFGRRSTTAVAAEYVDGAAWGDSARRNGAAGEVAADAASVVAAERCAGGRARGGDVGSFIEHGWCRERVEADSGGGGCEDEGGRAEDEGADGVARFVRVPHHYCFRFRDHRVEQGEESNHRARGAVALGSVRGVQHARESRSVYDSSRHHLAHGHHQQHGERFERAVVRDGGRAVGSIY